jgi:phosphoketolase
MKTNPRAPSPDLLQKTDDSWRAATIPTPFDLTVPNNRDCLHLGMGVVARVPRTGKNGICLKQQLKDKLVEHKQRLDRHGQDLPEIRRWTWDRGAMQKGTAWRLWL